MKNFLHLFLFLLLACLNTDAQNCSVIISGSNCTNTRLDANITGGEAAQITWYQYDYLVFGSDTISSPTDISIVAGNNGTGNAANQFGFPGGGIAVDVTGNVYVTDHANNRIQKWAPGATSGVTVAGGHGAGSAANQLSGPTDVFVDAAGNIYVADNNNFRIQKWAPGATIGVTVAGGHGSGSAANQLAAARAVYVDKQGNIYIADTYNYRIQRWRPGAIRGVTVAGGNGIGTAANQFYYPIDVYLDAAKNIYVADAFVEDASGHRVQKWAPGATSGVTVAGGNGVGNAANQFGYLLAIYVDSAGNIYATDNGIDGSPVSRVQRWNVGSTSGVTVAGGHSSGWDILSYPTGVALGSNGLLYVLDGTYNPKVQKYILSNAVVDTTFTPTQPGTYEAKVLLKNGCNAMSDNFIVRAKPGTPVIYATQPKGRGNLCSGGIDTFFVYPWDDITDYKWTIPPGCNLVSNFNDSIVIAVPEGFKSGKLIAGSTNICGTSVPDTTHLVGRPLPPAYIKGPRQVFANQAGVIYSVTDINTNHNWIVPDGTIIQYGQGTSSISVNWGSAGGIISVNSYNDCGEAPKRKELEVTLKSSFSKVNQNATGESLKDNDAIVFPSPANNIATVKFNSVKQTNYTIELQDMNGKILAERKITATQGSNVINFDVSKYSQGVYLIKIKNPATQISLKLAKQ